jgi:anaphase-promoting complex subunit 3
LQSLPRDRKRQPRTRSQSQESEIYEGVVPPGEPVNSGASSTTPQFPFPEDAPAKPRADEPSSQEIYEMELAEYTVYNTMRCCAKALRAFATYDLQTCIAELECLDAVHQRTPWVMAMVGKAEYEKGDYSAVRIVPSLVDSSLNCIIRLNVHSSLFVILSHIV